jgi:hypothetical protein
LVVDGVAPHAADAPGLGKGAAREAAEDVEEHVVREADSVAACLVHLGGRLLTDELGEGLRWEGSMEIHKDRYRLEAIDRVVV